MKAMCNSILYADVCVC